MEGGGGGEERGERGGREGGERKKEIEREGERVINQISHNPLQKKEHINNYLSHYL